MIALFICTILLSVKAPGALGSQNLPQKYQLSVIRGDIFDIGKKERLEAIVNSANEGCVGGKGLNGAIHTKAGPNLRAACMKLPIQREGRDERFKGQCRCPTGQARTTLGFKLPYRFVIHTVAPRYSEDDEPKAIILLSRAVYASLNEANKYNIKSMAFPALGMGKFAFSPNVGSQAIIDTIRLWFKGHPQRSIRRVAIVVHPEDHDIANAFKTALANKTIVAQSDKNLETIKNLIGSRFVELFLDLSKKMMLTTSTNNFVNDLAIIEKAYEIECSKKNSSTFFPIGGLQPFIKKEIDVCISQGSSCPDDHLNGLLRMYGLTLHRTFPEAKMYKMIQESERVKCKLTTKLFEALTSQLNVPVEIDDSLEEEFEQATFKYSIYQARYKDGVLSTPEATKIIPIAVAYLSNTDFVQERDKRCNLNTFFRDELSYVCIKSFTKLKAASQWWNAVQNLAFPHQFYVAKDLENANTEAGIQQFCLDLHIKRLEVSILKAIQPQPLQPAIDQFMQKLKAFPLARIPSKLQEALDSPRAILSYYKEKFERNFRGKVLTKQLRNMLRRNKVFDQEVSPEVFTSKARPDETFATPYGRSMDMCTFLLQPSWDQLRAPLSAVKVTLTEPLTIMRDRFMGVLFGAAAGDAFGASYEFMTRDDIKNFKDGTPLDLKNPQLFNKLKQYDTGVVTYVPGVYTDDTCMALCIIAMYIERGTVDCISLLRKFQSWADVRIRYMNFSSKHRDVGQTTETSLLSEEPYGKLPSNGGIMRQWPNVLFNAFRPVEVAADTAAATSALTHGHPTARDAARLLAVITYDLLHGVSKEELNSPNYLVRKHPDFWQRRPMAPNLINANIFSVLDLLVEEEEGLGCAYLYPFHINVKHRKGAGLAGPAIRGALEAFFATNSYLEGLVYVVLKGWDSDTTGAIYGQIAGAFYKKSGIPGWMIQKLYASPALQQLGKAMWRRAQDPTASLSDLEIINSDGTVQDFNPIRLPRRLHGNNQNHK